MERSTLIKIPKADVNLVFSEDANPIDIARVSILVHLGGVVIGRGIEISTVGTEESLHLLGVAHFKRVAHGIGKCRATKAIFDVDVSTVL
eukprot:CAMPEP_0179434288 /NCGR_PEP_ID=MMETSP0799-20121207/18605_1 /TAXON_ID=46947 /ORGANISM="Geminigera cryophila, Strain CCMP2564" /LENGTH=89 /DNA_ID=CAMNT_0021212923 /DNA_START=39 /DNA_END=308 /DNA_ORIENTATION=+